MYQYITVRVTGMLVYPRASAPRWQCIRIQCTSVPGHYCRRRFGVPVNPTTPISQRTVTHVYQRFGVHMCTKKQCAVYQLANVPVFRCTGVTVYRYTGVLIPPPPPPLQKQRKKGSQKCRKNTCEVHLDVTRLERHAIFRKSISLDDVDYFDALKSHTYQ